MEIEQVAELARTVAALPEAERDYFDGVVADERAKAAEAARIAKMRDMPDGQVIALAVKAGKSSVSLPSFGKLFEGVDVYEVARVLREAGFVRYLAGKSKADKADVIEAIIRVREVVQEIDGMARRGHPIENSPSLKHWLLCALDALTGENHSGTAVGLPEPKRKAG